MRWLFRRRLTPVRAVQAAPAVEPVPSLPRRIPGRSLAPMEETVMPEDELRELAVLVIRDAIRICRDAVVAEKAR